MSRTASTASSTGTTSGSSWGVQWLNNVLGTADDNALEQTLHQRRSGLDRATKPRGRRREEQPNEAPPDRARYKRTTSPDPNEVPAAAAADEDEQSTLVYVHTVRPTDTIEGISLTYHIPRDTLRRANGMWAQDGVQSRKTLLLPVDNCGVKGATLPVDEQAQQGEVAEERPYTHHSYVSLPHIGTVEIARLPRKKLSHFPPRRRRSPHRTAVPDDYSAHLELLAPVDIFRGMTAGVGELHPPPSHDPSHTTATTIGPTMKTLSELAQDTAVGLENVGSVVEGFVRRWTVKASDFVSNDLIELTQRLAFDEGDHGGGGDGRMERSESARSNRSTGSSGRATGGVDRRRVVRERLPRREGERSKVL